MTLSHSHPPGGRLPLLSARPAVTFQAEEHHRQSAGTKLYCLVTAAHACEHSLPKAVTCKRTGRDSNPRPFGSRTNTIVNLRYTEIIQVWKVIRHLLSFFLISYDLEDGRREWRHCISYWLHREGSRRTKATIPVRDRQTDRRTDTCTARMRTTHVKQLLVTSPLPAGGTG